MTAMIFGIMLPFLGTVLGAGCVLFMKGGFGEKVQKVLFGFAGGVMVAASVWSLLIPAMNMAEENGSGRLSFVPAVSGFLMGIFGLLVLDKVKIYSGRASMLLLAVTLHNIPEGMAVGLVFAGMIADSETITMAGAFLLAIGIAIQNFPEGAIISMPICAAGVRKRRAFLCGVLSGVVEPLGALLTVVLSRYLIPVMPYLLSFAAGAMVYVVIEELIPEAAQGGHGKIGTVGFAVGFAIMMALDVAFG